MLGLAPVGGAPVGGVAAVISPATSLWTPPRTWSNGEVVTASMANAHIRDNLLVIKTTRDAFGRLSELSTATLASLSAADLTGLALPAAGNAFTARNRMVAASAARIIVPVGADRWTGTKGVDAAGVWVEGNYLHHIASNATTEYRFLGVSLGAPGGGARAGSIWMEGATLHYIDASNVERYIYSYGTSGHSDALALGGSLWVETYLHGIGESGTTEYPFHADVAHGDATPHSDSSSHNDTGAHSDSTAHDDSGSGHSDHSDGHTDHTDSVHVDIYPHSDYSDHADHSDHSDSGPHGDSTSHGDHSDHTDSPTYNEPTVV